jgi:hypothetical protein
MKKNYISPEISEQAVVAELGFTVSNPAGGAFGDYVEDDYQW